MMNNMFTLNKIKKLLLVSSTILLTYNCQNTSNRRCQVDDSVIDASSYTVTNEVAALETAEDKIGKTLNDIRFAG